jgi:phage tail-like protein
MADRKDPYRGFKFRIEWDGIQQGGFREVSGVDFDQTPVEYRDGTDVNHVRKLPALNKYSNITLKRGITDNHEIWDWRKKCIDGKVERKNGSIVLLDETGQEKARWNFHEAWPTKLTIAGFNATSNDVAIEELAIAHEYVEKA